MDSFLSTWSNPFDQASQGQLNERGIKDMTDLAIHFKKRISGMEFALDQIQVQSTDKSRVKDSAKWFMKEFLGEKAGLVPILTKNKKLDSELKFHESCQVTFLY